MTGTVAIFTGLIIWNDFFLSLIFLNGTDKRRCRSPSTRSSASSRRGGISSSPAVIVSIAADHGLLPLRPAAADPGLHRWHQELGDDPWHPSPSRTSGKTYPDGTRAVTDLNLEIEDGEFIVFVGPSGCGKTTALRMVARARGGNRGRAANRRPRSSTTLAPQKRDIAMVFQNYALYPHMSVFDNIAFPLESQKMQKAEVSERVRADRRAARPHGAAQAASAKPLRRPAAARGDGSRDRAPAAGLPDGRAAVEPRREASRADACRDHAAPGASSGSRRSSSRTTRSRR